MTKDKLIFLTHIFEAIESIENFTKGTTKSEFLYSEMMQAAVVRKLEIIGEAAKNIKKDFRKKYPLVPWEDMAGTRDKLIHDYFDVDLKIVWDVIRIVLPPLKKQIQNILNQEKAKSD